MPSKTLVLSAEAVTSGQPDKLCDIVVDTILDQVMEDDRFARIDLEAIAAPGLVMVSGELSTKAYVDITGIVRKVLCDVGYNNRCMNFSAGSIAVLNILQEQSEEVALAVDKRGAGNQCIAIGYATNETEKVGVNTELMPIPIFTANRIARRLMQVRLSNDVPHLLPDGQVQVTFLYDNNVPTKLLNATLSAHHEENANLEVLRKDLLEKVLRPIIDNLGAIKTDNAELLVNHTGPFTFGGPEADVGISGRTTISDLYGTAVPCGGKSLSGKDPTKTDRAANYMARHVAKSVVAAGLADRCEVRLVYLFGRENPISIQVNTFSTSKHGSDKALAEAIDHVFDLSTAGIVEHLDLRRVSYAPICCGGHVGRVGVPWEEVTHTEELLGAMDEKMKG